MITQNELTRFKELQAELRVVEDELKALKNDLTERFLEKEEPVEHGLFSIVRRGGKRTPAWKQYVIRLGGEGYVKNIIAHTSPGPDFIEVK